MGIAYPTANRFRTGMAIAMFSLILFSITVMSVINASFLNIFAGDEARAGWDVYATTNRNTPVDDLTGALQSEGSVDISPIRVTARLTAIDDDRQSVRVVGDEEWEKYIARAADDSFWARAEMKLEGVATGYADDKAVFEAMRTTPGLAVIEGAAFVADGFGGQFTTGETIKDGRFDPLRLEIRNEATGQVETVTVIGALSNKIPAGLFPGVLISELTHTKLFGSTEFRDYLIRVAPGTDSERLAKSIEGALSTSGVQAFSIEKEIDEAMGTQRGFMRVIQLFMGLGLVVGIAAVGVISLRSVVERRQQIGMLRAIGYERRTVAMSFLFETAFIALMGIGSGILGAVLLSRNLLESEDFTATAGLTFYVPWPEVIVMAVIAFGFALLMTWWPSRQAASVPIAEALRYE
jgi:putative ABC transport system permease protein